MFSLELVTFRENNVLFGICSYCGQIIVFFGTRDSFMENNVLFGMWSF